LSEELVAQAALGDEVARKLLGELAYRSEDLKEVLREVGILLGLPSARTGLTERGST
jgi:hypothetical protein